MSSVRSIELRQLWLARIGDLSESGLTQQAWCDEKGIKISCLKYWLHKLRDQEPQMNSPCWLKIGASANSRVAELQILPEPLDQKTDSIRIHCGNFTAELPPSYSREQMFTFLQMVKEL